jgi:hypothetical protein
MRRNWKKENNQLIKKVQQNIKKSRNDADQQHAFASYYTMEAMELLQKQNKSDYKQNDKIIELLQK